MGLASCARGTRRGGFPPPTPQGRTTSSCCRHPVASTNAVGTTPYVVRAAGVLPWGLSVSRWRTDHLAACAPRRGRQGPVSPSIVDRALVNSWSAFTRPFRRTPGTCRRRPSDIEPPLLLGSVSDPKPLGFQQCRAAL